MSIQKSWIKVFKPEKQFGNDVIKNEGSFDEKIMKKIKSSN